MNKTKEAVINTKWIVSHRGKKNYVNPYKPYAWLVEKERVASGKIEDVATVFLTNRECPFNCLMCDLWKNTTDTVVPVGAIPAQIKFALTQLPKTKHIKLYNSGSFFDKKAIPIADYEVIVELLSPFETVIVESHPKFIDKKCIDFKNLLKPNLQVAIGLETVHPESISKLNKQMSLNDFKKAVAFLKKHNIKTRTFILLKTPFLSEAEGVFWAKKSIDFAFKVGVNCCTVIPVRAGNGAMDLLEQAGNFSKPQIQSLEAVLAYGVGLKKAFVFADTWDLKLFSNCTDCIDKRIDNITKINLTQKISGQIDCHCNETYLVNLK